MSITLQGPARPQRLTAVFDRSGDRLALLYRSRGIRNGATFSWFG